ncbi:hypothetical protein ACFQVC_28010 [Streptomyces monticola]|uniref:Tetratricopeptide repeat protein n=1 Tax=Streptomyces monticola TaxID=2666263 RepID=A0ABW2JR29_9ACTN
MSGNRIPNDRLRALLAEAEWTFENLAQAVNRAAQEIALTLVYDRSSVAHWLAGTQPRSPAPQLIAEVFSRRLGRTVTVPAAGFPGSDREETSGVTPRKDASAVTHLADLTGIASDAVQRAVLQQSPYQPDAHALPHWRAPSRRPAGRRPAGSGSRSALPRAGRTEVTTLKAAVRSFAAGLDRHGGGHARTALTVFLADDVVPWLTRPADEQIRVELLTEAAHLTYIAARLYSDAGLHGAAQRYYATALRLANEAENHTAWAVILRGLSSQALALGHRHTALNHAENACSALPAKAPTAVRSFIHAQIAVARAASGHNRRQVLTALAAAEQAATKSRTLEGPFATYPQAAREFQRAQALHRLGDLTGATEALEASSRHRSPDDRRGHTLTHALRAELLVRHGHVEEACESWRAFFKTADGLLSTDVDSARARLRRAFHPYFDQLAVKSVLVEQRTGYRTD